ncbi:hypothetical protein RC79_08870 [Pectobacterium brasiliense]|uniref:hypothetical protein n=1 Tax=Pectobacterium brasiliense TaxID=180957 RepID=UPI00057F638C|nr:hypothetical protein [Pectobacterium brasiliense]KHS74327.1 hypothetical protein RC79_08870 [Pectobacterium brasiliense]
MQQNNSNDLSTVLNALNDKHYEILAISVVSCLVRKGLLDIEEIMSEVAQQGVPAEWAKPIYDLMLALPVK